MLRAGSAKGVKRTFAKASTEDEKSVLLLHLNLPTEKLPAQLQNIKAAEIRFMCGL